MGFFDLNKFPSRIKEYLLANISEAHVFVNWNIAIRGPKANVIIRDASSPYIDRVD